ncbi:alpha/beta hydrolase [Candidatus Daviesbacteria bacterium]|nr:alpha/beta hydrolase [Candidatus Daviesbacteria bacterium]
MTESSEIPSKDGMTRRTFFKGLGIAGAIGTAVVVGGAALAEKSLGKSAIERTYQIGRNVVELSGQDFLPKEGKVNNSEEAVLFLVGAPMRARTSVTWEQPRQLADQFKARAYTLDARPKGNFDTNSVDLEVEALRRFIEEKGIKKLTIFGHSIGAAKAIKLAVSLEQNNPNIKINGVVAANPMGLYSQDRGDLLSRYIPEIDNVSKLANPKASHENMIKTAIELVGSTAADMRQTKLGYKRWVDEQFEALTEVNPDLSKMKAPVVLLIASQDQWAQAGMILPETEIAKRLPPVSFEGLRKREILSSSKKWADLSEDERAEFGSKDIFIKQQRNNIAERGRAKNQYAKEKYFPQAENLLAIVGTKYASHISFTVERVGQSTHVVSKIFERLRRENTYTKAA